MRVLQSFKQPGTQVNPYVTQLLESLDPFVEVSTFTWRQALLGRYEILHVHWPEVRLRGGGPVRRIVKSALFALLMIRISIFQTGVVRTRHNLTPHEPASGIERLLLDWCERMTSLGIEINQPGLGAPLYPTVTILHGHYKDWVKGMGREVARDGHLCYFGSIRAYKGVETLVRAFHGVQDSQVSLSITGNCPDVALGARLRQATQQDERVSLDLSFVSDPTLVLEVTRAELVVLPYEDMGNSGAVLFALSLDRPVLVPRTRVNVELAREVGSGWVLMFDPPLTASHLTEALRMVQRCAPESGPDLALRDWTTTGTLHFRAYARVLART